jgi:hypothetical protein
MKMTLAQLFENENPFVANKLKFSLAGGSLLREMKPETEIMGKDCCK